MSSGDMIVKNRFLGFLIWQWIQSTSVYAIFKIIIISLFTTNSFTPSLVGCLSFLTFHLSLLLFSVAVFTVTSAKPNRASSPLELSFGLVRWLVISGKSSPDFRQRAKVSLTFVLFVAASALSGLVSVVSVCQVNWDAFDGVAGLIKRVGLRGFAFGLLYGLYYVFKKRWVLEFPIIQRRQFFSFKMGLPSAIKQALKLSSLAFLFSAVLVVFLRDQFKGQLTMRKFIAEQVIFYIGSFTVFLCWELSHHLHQVLHTKGLTFAPPKGSAAAETNPSEPLLAALEESSPGSILQHLAYLDLCMVCESNVDCWRRAAFFEETGDTYKRVVAVCLRPLEQLASNLSEGLERVFVDNTDQLSRQLRSPADSRLDSKFYESFSNFQVCAWAARSAASLTAHSHKEDRFGVAQLSGSNAATISTLISCLLGVEMFMGKKTNLQSSPAGIGIRWAALNTGGRNGETAAIAINNNRRRSEYLHSKAYAMADILRTSIYGIVSAFHAEMMASAKSRVLDKDWVLSNKPSPHYGGRELLLEKLRLFLDFRA